VPRAEEPPIARRATGNVLERKTKKGKVWALRFRAYGTRRYVTLGSAEEGWSGARAEEELQNVLADVRRGLWKPPIPERAAAPEEIATTPGFHQFASDWLAGRRGEVTERGVEYYGWALSHHLLPYFADYRLEEITIEEVDKYRRFKVQQSEERREALAKGRPKLPRTESPPRPLGPTTINKTIDVLAAVLALAAEYGHIDRNPATGRRRRLKPPARRPVHLDTTEQIQVLLEAAGELDNSEHVRSAGRRVLIATLLFAGLRAGEACALKWGDVDLANGRIHVGRSKTQAGLREITLLPVLRDELASHRASMGEVGPADPVFLSASGRARDKDNLRNRVLASALVRADELLAERDRPPLPKGITPHKLRHTYASILVACGEDPSSVMSQIGHTDPQFTLRIYTHLMRRDPAERERLKTLVYGKDSSDPGALGAPSPAQYSS
jgi:integrase